MFNHKSFCRIATTVISGVCLLFSSHAVAQLNYQTIALTGLGAPGTAPGVNYDRLRFSGISNAGEVSFVSDLTGPGVTMDNDGAFFQQQGGTLSLIAREGDAAPGFAPGVTFRLIGIDRSVSTPAFGGQLLGPGVMQGDNDGVFFSAAGGTLQPIAAAGSPVPELGVGVNLDNLSLIESVNSAGEVVFNSRVTGPGVTTANDNGLFFARSGNPVSVVAREGQPAPGTGPGSNFGAFPTTALSLNDAGDAVFEATLSTGSSGIFSNVGGSLHLVALDATQAPGAPLGANFVNLAATSPRINNAGEIAFEAELVGDRSGIFSGATGNLDAVAISGDAAPGIGGGVTFESFQRPVINRQGDTAFTAVLTGPGVNADNNTAVYAERNGVLRLVARSGDPAPGLELGTNFEIGSFVVPSINANGELAFETDVTGPTVSFSNAGTLYAEIGGELQLVAREGVAFDVNPDPMVEDLRVPTSNNAMGIEFRGGSGGEDGRPTAFNAAGQLVFELNFLDGTSGVFLAQSDLSGDFDLDGDVDGNDFLVWQRTDGTAQGLQAWRDSYGTSTLSAATNAQPVPEPVTAVSLMLGITLMNLCRGCRLRRSRI